MTKYFFLIIVFMLSACAGKSTSQINHSHLNQQATLEGTASWYGRPFHGRKTASGERYNMNDMTVASKELPFGTELQVVNTENNMSVTVRVNDRGPYVGNRVLDLSFAAAKAIDMVRSGTAQIKAWILNPSGGEEYSLLTEEKP